MKDQIKRILNARGEAWFGFILLCFSAALAVSVILFITADHKVRCYYLKSNHTSAGISYKVISDIDWGEDVMAFTSPDPEKTLLVIGDLKQCAAK